MASWRRGRDSPPAFQNARVSAGLLILFQGHVYPTRVSLATELSASEALAINFGGIGERWEVADIVRIPEQISNPKIKPDEKADARHPRTKPRRLGVPLRSRSPISRSPGIR